MPYPHGTFDLKTLPKRRPSGVIKKRRNSTVYELTISLIAKRLYKRYPDDHFLIQASTWSRPALKITKGTGVVMFKIWSQQLFSSKHEPCFVENESIERAYDLICELKEAQKPRDVINFLKEEKK